MRIDSSALVSAFSARDLLRADLLYLNRHVSILYCNFHLYKVLECFVEVLWRRGNCILALWSWRPLWSQAQRSRSCRKWSRGESPTQTAVSRPYHLYSPIMLENNSEQNKKGKQEKYHKITINQSISLLSTVHSETNKCKLRKNAQWRAASEAICLSMLAANNENKLSICWLTKWGTNNHTITQITQIEIYRIHYQCDDLRFPTAHAK